MAGLGEAAFLPRLCLTGDAVGEDSGLMLGAGDWATNVPSRNPVKAIMRAMDLVMAAGYRLG
jgi:hypothetical protein